MQQVSATVITYNEEDRVGTALESLRWADEIVVVDCGSTDCTLEVCGRFTERIFHRDWTGFVDQKNFAMDRARHDWILSLDADERIGPELRLEIEALRRAGFPMPGYRIPRIAFFMGRWIRHGDWYPDYQLRLFDRRRGRWQGGHVHESVRIEGAAGVLKGEIRHYTYRDLSDYLDRLDTYSSLAAADYEQRGKIADGCKLLFNPVATFLKTYLLRRGFLDGVPGLMVSALGAISVYFKYAKLYEIQRKAQAPIPARRPEPRNLQG